MLACASNSEKKAANRDNANEERELNPRRDLAPRRVLGQKALIASTHLHAFRSLSWAVSNDFTALHTTTRGTLAPVGQHLHWNKPSRMDAEWGPLCENREMTVCSGFSQGRWCHPSPTLFLSSVHTTESTRHKRSLGRITTERQVNGRKERTDRTNTEDTQCTTR